MSDCDLLNSFEGCCDWCGKELRGRRTRWCSRKCNREFVANHRWTQAKAAAKKAATFYQCAMCGGYVAKVEVDHIEACLGKHGIWGCHHHQDNLRVLCPPCHRQVTKQQHEQGVFRDQN
jgi:hypothetical protein